MTYGIDLSTAFINIHMQIAQMLEGKREIKRCSHPDCNNIFYADTQRRKYCLNEKCRAERRAENSRESENRSRDTIRRRIVHAIDGWLMGEEQIDAAELIEQIPIIEKILRGQKNLTKSLGSYLKGQLMKELLKEKGINLTITKGRDKNFYSLDRVVIP